MGQAYINLSWTCLIYIPVVPVSLLIGLNDKRIWSPYSGRPKGMGQVKGGLLARYVGAMGGCGTEEWCDPTWVWTDYLSMRTDLGGRVTVEAGRPVGRPLKKLWEAMGVQTGVVAVLGTCGWIWGTMQSPGVVRRLLKGSASWLSLWGTALYSLLSPLTHHRGKAQRIPVCCSRAEAVGIPRGRDLWRVLHAGSLQKGIRMAARALWPPRLPKAIFGKDVGHFGPEPTLGSVLTTPD